MAAAVPPPIENRVGSAVIVTAPPWVTMEPLRLIEPLLAMRFNGAVPFTARVPAPPVMPPAAFSVRAPPPTETPLVYVQLPVHVMAPAEVSVRVLLFVV